MKIPFRGKPTTTAAYIVLLVIFGVLVSKIFEHEVLQSVFVDALTVALLIALIILAWITGWLKGQGG
jgi:protein-S-isoprenylcysteine O-methyltransferase Ste14